MSFLGMEYTFDRQENFEEFVHSLGLTDEQAKGFINYHPDQKLITDGDSYTLITTTPQTKNELNFKSGVPFEQKLADRPCKTTYTLNGNTLNQVQEFENGGVLNYARVFSDTELIVTITSNKYIVFVGCNCLRTVRRFYKLKE